MKHRRILSYCFALIAAIFFAPVSFAQDLNVTILAGTYLPNNFKGYNPDGSIKGIYRISLSKSAHVIQPGQFNILVGFPPAAQYDGNIVLPAEFTLSDGDVGQSFLTIDITGTWPAGNIVQSLRIIDIPIRIVGRSISQPTGTDLQWLDPFVQENPDGNSAGDNLSVEDVLPVTLANFTARKEGQTTLLKWETTEETKSDQFIIQKSLNSKNWHEIGTRKAQGESSTFKPYQFIDEAPDNGINYYRLKMVDLDGTYSYSQIKTVHFDGLSSIASVYPNPASDFVKIKMQDFNSLKSIKIYNLNGQNVYAAQGSSLSDYIDVKSLGVGQYVVEMLSISGQIKTNKIVINR
jgi:hypothetical protein